MSITSDANSTFLNVDNAHLRVAGDIHATSVKVGAIEIVPGYSLESTTGIGNTTPHTVEFTNTETSLVTSGDINMLHSSNNAAIKLNSNVVTEFPRSKKLIKYPRVAMTQNDESGTSGYVASASATNPNRDPYRAFDNVLYSSWHEPVYQVNPYPNFDGAYTGGSGTVYDTNGYQGEYLQIQLPEKIKLYNYSISNRAAAGIEGRQPKDAKIFASNDGTTWIDIHTHSDGGGTYDIVGETRSFQLDNITETHYKYYRLVINSIIQGGTSDTANISQWKLYGIPEYDPDANGVDVVVKSIPNVPNTDWLEVYYDAKDLADGAVTSIDDLTPSGTNDGTAIGGVTVSDGAFVLDGAGDYISTSITTSMTVHTASMWIQFDRSGNGWECVYFIGPSSSLDRNNINLYNNNGYFRLESNGGTNGPYFDFVYNFEIGKWVHLTLIFRGTGLEDCEMYINNERLLPRGVSRSSTDDITITGTNNIYVGSDSGNSYYHDGKIANFRLFNRALTSDEIWQLYAYQKEYFGHGDLSMTLKAGRLGIGTSEPRAMLDVRGIIRSKRPMWSAGYNPGSNTVLPTMPSTTGIVFGNLNYDYTGNYSTSTGHFTAPVSGYYFIGTRALLYIPTGETRIDADIRKVQKNGTIIRVIQGERLAGSQGGRATNHNMSVQISGTVYLVEGEQVYPSYKKQEETVSTYIVTIGNDFNEFWGFLIEQV